jgi:hypothetical protein
MMGEMFPMTTADYAAAAAQEADSKATNARTEIESLKLQVQELRQFSLWLITGVIQHTPGNHQIIDYWWNNLSSYPRVEEPR